MARRWDVGKDAAWRKRLERFTRSGLTVARFCDGEGVSVASLYYWRKKLGQTASGRRSRSRRGVFRQLAVLPTPPAMPPGRPAVAGHAPAVGPAASAEVPASSRIVIQLPCGTRIEVDVAHLDTVPAVVGEVAPAHGGVQTGTRSC